MPEPRIVVDGQTISFRQGDSVLEAMLRAKEHPTGGGCLCLGGDCPFCLATVDGVSYVRTCQVKARPGLVVERHPKEGDPPLPSDDHHRSGTEIRYKFCDVAVVSQDKDPAGLQEQEKAISEGKKVLYFETEDGAEAVGLYAGPLLVVRFPDQIWHVRVKERVVIATGTAQILPVVPGSELQGLVTSNAAVKLLEAGIDLGEVVAIGPPPEGVECRSVTGEVVGFEGKDGKLVAVLTDDGAKHSCDAACLNLGSHPRNQLALMGTDLGIPVDVVGDAAGKALVPVCPRKGTVCPCSQVTFDDLEYTWDSGFQEMELIKRSTLAGTGACQGMTCLPYLRSFIKEKTGTAPPRFTARPMVRQLTLGEIAAGGHHSPDLHTSLHDEHVRAGAHMERSGPWWRPWNYGDLEKEYWAVREGVSLMDVSTLGKMIVSGPDALAFLEKIYPTTVSTIKPGRARYVLLLDERGYVFDDGLVAKESDTRFALTLTSSGSSHGEMWLRDWAHGFGMDVRILNQTYSLGAINVTGPLAGELLSRVGLDEPLKFMNFADLEICGVPCRVYRLSFTGELSFELHHCSSRSVELWRALMTAGRDLGIRPHGLEALTQLRLEKGHIIVHQDTDFDSTPRRIDHEWMVKMGKEAFIGRQALVRTNAIEPDKYLVGMEMDGEPPIEGASIWNGDDYAGFVTSVGYSPALGKSVLLGHLYLKDGELPESVTIDSREARRVKLPFYDEKGTRARA